MWRHRSREEVQGVKTPTVIQIVPSNSKTNLEEML